MLLARSHPHTSPLYAWAPAGDWVVLAHPASTRTIAMLIRALIRTSGYAVDSASDRCGGQIIQTRCQYGVSATSTAPGPPTGKRATEKCSRALTTPCPTRITER